jgi:acyl-CoA thioester hydrolase
MQSHRQVGLVFGAWPAAVGAAAVQFRAMAPAERHEVEVEVRYAETDQMGVVHHANYLVWFELARTALCRQSGFHYAEVERLGYLLMVSGAQLSYRRGVRYGDTVRVAAWLEHLGSRGMRFAYEVRRGDEICATGTTEHVWVERASGKPCRTPEPLRAPFARLAGVDVR